MTNDELLASLLNNMTMALYGPTPPGHAAATLKQVDELRARLAAAESIVARGVELMSLEQLSKWEGVREWQERVA